MFQHWEFARSFYPGYYSHATKSENPLLALDEHRPEPGQVIDQARLQAEMRALCTVYFGGEAPCATDDLKLEL
jgi:hypothetical protein